MMMAPAERAWFARHPHRRYRIRAATPAEMGGSELTGPHVRIIRNRAPRHAMPIVTSGLPANNDAEAARLLLAAALELMEPRH